MPDVSTVNDSGSTRENSVSSKIASSAVGNKGTSPSGTTPVLPKLMTLNGKNYPVGFLKGRMTSEQKAYLAAALSTVDKESFTAHTDNRFTYGTKILVNPDIGQENFSVEIALNTAGQMSSVTLKNSNEKKELFYAEFDNTTKNTMPEASLRLNEAKPDISAKAVFDGAPLPWHPDGERYKAFPYIQGGGKPPIVLTGIPHANGHKFDVYDIKNNEFLLQLPMERSRKNAPADEKINILISPSDARLPGGMRHFKRKALGVKASWSSPTKYKKDGIPCDRHGNTEDGSGSSEVASSSSVGPHQATSNPASTSLQHISLPIVQRPYSAYATTVRQALHGHGAERVNAHAATYYSEVSQPVSAITALNGVIASLDHHNPDEARLSEFLQHLQSQAAAGHPVSLPDYYHCTKDQGFDEMLSSSNPRINVQTPSTGYGAKGAWLSTSPEVNAYGPFIFGFNHHLDLLHSTTHPTEGRATVRNVAGNYHVGIQEPISLTGRNISNNDENPLSVVGAPANSIGEYKSMIANLGPQLSFPRADGSRDVAVFNTETVQKLAKLLRQQEPLKYPKSW
jgi:hypothetical protein